MSILVLLLLLLISILLAIWSLTKQRKVKEVEFVNRELKKRRVIFDHSSSSDREAS